MTHHTPNQDIHESHRPQPVLRRLLPVMAVLLGLLIAGGYGVFFHTHEDRLRQASLMAKQQTVGDLNQFLKEQTRSLEAMLELILLDAELITALKAGDRKRLLAMAEPLFERLNAHYAVTHFYFSDAQRVCLLRVHKPEKYGDRFDRFTALEAERTGRTAGGAELGPLGTFTLRVVRPVFHQGRLLGYVELGKEIEDILDALVAFEGVEMILAIHKDNLNQAQWEAGMALLGRGADWNRLPDHVVIYASMSLPEQAGRFIGCDDPGCDPGGATSEIRINSSTWQLTVSLFKDASGRQIGELLLLYDVSGAKAGQRRLMLATGAGAGVLLSALLFLVFTLLRRADAAILAQQVELRENEERFRSLFLDNPVSMIIQDPHSGEIIDANPIAWGYYGLSSLDELKAWELWLDPPYSLADAQAWMRKAHQEGTQQFEWLSRKQNGNLIWEEVQLTPIVHLGRKAILVTGIDITDRREAEQQTQEVHQRLLTVMNAMDALIYIADMQTHELLFINAYGRLIFGDAVGRKCWEAIQSGASGPCAFCTNAQLLDDHGQPAVVHQWEFQNTITKRWYECRDQAIPWTDGHFVRMEVAMDITERKQAEDQLRKLSMAVEQSPAIIIITDLQANIEYVNPAFISVTGYTFDEVIGQNPRVLKSSDRLPEDYRELWETITSGRQWRGELKNIRKNGEVFWEAASIAPIFNDQGQATHYLAVKEDITERKQLEHCLLDSQRQLEDAVDRAREMAAQAKAANRAKSEFLANMSHEIRTPMNGVIGMTGLLLDTELSEEQRQYADIVQSSAESLLALINDILDFSKIEAGKLDLEILDFDLPDLMEDLAAALALPAQKKGLEFICAVDAGVPARLHGDPGRLRQVLTNLVSNAIKFTAEGEVVVTVAVAPAAEPPQETDAAASDARNTVTLRFSIRDTGIGIPEDKIDLLFNKFSQVDASITRKFGGTGLGLAISMQLAEMMGGKAGVVSTPGQGSEFWFTALFGIQETTAGPATWDAPGELSGRRVLVVDDNATNLKILMNQLAAWDMRPQAAESGEAALQVAAAAHAQSDPFDLAVVDFQMPGMDGGELARRLKADARFQALPLVMLTSLGRPGDARLFADMGFAAYLNKPIRQSELFDTLSLVMATNGARPPSAPIITRHLARETRRRHAQTPRLSGRVLVAEDNPVNQKVALGILKQFGLRVQTVGNGREAITALGTMPFDLVLMDVQMPDMDGLEATREIRRLEAGTSRRIPIIAMTAGAMAEDRENCLTAGMDDYVTKPVVREKLVEVLARWLSARPETDTDAVAAQPHPSGTRPAVTDTDGTPIWNRDDFSDRTINDPELMELVLSMYSEDSPHLSG